MDVGLLYFPTSTCDSSMFLAPLEKGSKLEQLVTQIRTRKGLKVTVFVALLKDDGLFVS